MSGALDSQLPGGGKPVGYLLRRRQYRLLTILPVKVYCKVLVGGGRDPVPDRCAHQAGTSPLLFLNTVS